MRSPRGNALLLILLAVVLFAALSFAVTQSGRGGGGSADKEQLRLTVARMLQHASVIEQAVTRLRLINKCTPAQISFFHDDAPNKASHNNLSSPADKSCHVFDPAGGNVSYALPPANMTTGTGWYAGYAFSGHMNHGGTLDGGNIQGTWDVGLELAYIPDTVCAEINRQVFGDPAIKEVPWIDVGGFAGTFVGFSGYQQYLQAPITACVRPNLGAVAPLTMTTNVFVHTVLLQ